MKEYILFDLDGTLTDPKLGITTCVQYALDSFGIQEPDLDKLECFIGPPLKDSFMEFYGMSEEDAQKAIAKYRERFSTVGKFENEVYKGIPKLLGTLKSKGMHLAIASSKPTVFVKEILEHFGLIGYFEVIVGSELDGTRGKKEEVVTEALMQLFHGREIRRDRVYMIGDRCFDVEGARNQGIESVAVAYGYGSLDELMEAHADYIVCTVGELEEFLLRTDVDERKLPTLNQRIWTILANCLIFFGARIFGGFLAGALFLSLAQKSDMAKQFFAMTDVETGTMVLSGNGQAATAIVGYALAILFIRKTFLHSVKKTHKEHFLSHLWWIPVWQYVVAVVGTLMLVLGLNGIIGISGLARASAAYEQTAALQYGSSLWIGCICYGILAPIAEEMLYRGILYGYSRRCFGILQGMLLSAVLFGALHFNMVQGLYAFVMGFVFAYLYEYFGTFVISVVLHILANLTAYLLTQFGWYEVIYHPIITISTFVVGACCIGYLLYKKKRLLTL